MTQLKNDVYIITSHITGFILSDTHPPLLFHLLQDNDDLPFSEGQFIIIVGITVVQCPASTMLTSLKLDNKNQFKLTR